MGTTSNEAAKLYDAAITQLISWQDESQLGGLVGTLNKLIEVDPNFGELPEVSRCKPCLISVSFQSVVKPCTIRFNW